MNITVIIPTYRRPNDLARCLSALVQQTRLADEVVVVARDTDQATWEFLAAYQSDLRLQTVTVNVPGVVAAMNAGLDVTSGELVAFTDDDAAPHKDWLETLESHFLIDAHVGAVGGRDVMCGRAPAMPAPKRVEIVGKVQWFGRVIGNHSYGTGKAREVDVLKGVNMGFRVAALKEVYFDQRMRGTGAQVYFEDGCCLSLKRRGWKIIYDPQIVVDHYVAQRFDEDKRRQFVRIALVNKVHNETLNLLEYFSPLRRGVFLLWAIAIGTRNNRGLAQCLRFLPAEGGLSLQKLLAAWQGRWLGWQTWRQSQSTQNQSTQNQSTQNQTAQNQTAQNQTT
ncbi:MAG: glycosyltransferase family 2 protein [Cyanobacteria bacterium J06631_12]